jgi:hypothetical protein
MLLLGDEWNKKNITVNVEKRYVSGTKRRKNGVITAHRYSPENGVKRRRFRSGETTYTNLGWRITALKPVKNGQKRPSFFAV